MTVLDEQFAKLQDLYRDAKIRPNGDGSHVIFIPDLPLPPGWNKTAANIYFVVPAGYPFARPDCFWTDQDLRLAHGGVPTNTNQNAQLPGESKPLLWFSYHPGAWNPNGDSVITYLNVIKKRLTDAR